MIKYAQPKPLWSIMRLKTHLIFVLLLFCAPSHSDVLRVAVASNFAKPAKALTNHFNEMTGHMVTLSLGSSGKHFAQIVHGAPFDVFLSADTERPARLEAMGLSLSGYRRTYALGQLVMLYPDTEIEPETYLRQNFVTKIAIAQPKIAPYGRASQEVLENLNAWDLLKSKLVFGENIAQTYQFVASRHADTGFVALSQVAGQEDNKIKHWLVPSSLYSPIKQEMVILKRTSVPEIARSFFVFLSSEPAQAIIREHGYTTVLSPEAVPS